MVHPPFTEADRKLFDDALAKIEEAIKHVNRATQAGLDSREHLKSLQDNKTQILKILQTYFQ